MKTALKCACVVLLAYCGVAAAAGAGTITSISPNFGPNTGNITVVIRGTGFGTAAKVLFGGATQSTITLVGTTRISCQLPASVPAGTVGNVAVDVQTAGSVSLLLATGTFTYTNPTLTVTAQARINSVVDISWATSTSNDSNGTAHPDLNVAPYTWVIASTSSADAATASIGFSSVYTMSDDYTVNIRNRGTGTGSTVHLNVGCGNMGPWNNTGASGSNAFKMQAKLGTGTPLTLTTTLSVTALQNTGNTANETITSGNAKQFDLIFTAPSAITTGYDTLQSATVTITGTAE